MGKKVTVDLTGVESFQRCSEGIHTVKVASAEVKQSQGGNDMIVVAFEVTKGADKGSRVYENFPLVDAALWKLKGFLVAIGMKADGKVSVDLDKLIGKVCNINVIHEEYDGKLRARCESIMKFAAESSDDDEDDIEEDEDEEEEEEEEEKEEKPAKKSGKDKASSKKAPMNPPEEDEDDDWDDDDDEEEEEEEKPAPKKKSAPKEDKKAKPEKKAAKKSKKDEDEDDDWDDDDWDEEDE